ncbi:hypothetical protein [Francisella uliginis]|uniref:Lipoprotein n=1 Tax=Francisella uliginis TaxID=573570 RepID=A0A1L4BQ37_9GAMM|nr:hypothetical protein [Francisella uliginis]API85946.1 hypothetical protein F7310_00615 [Francisella uliginis]
MKRILLTILLFTSVSAFACSNKDQLTITINTIEKANFPHKAYIALGKKLFNDDLLSNELHSYDVAINHSSGTMIFDIESSKMKKQIQERAEKLLTQQGLCEIRVTHDKLQKIKK